MNLYPTELTRQLVDGYFVFLCIVFLYIFSATVTQVIRVRWLVEAYRLIDGNELKTCDWEFVSSSIASRHYISTLWAYRHMKGIGFVLSIPFFYGLLAITHTWTWLYEQLIGVDAGLLSMIISLVGFVSTLIFSWVIQLCCTNRKKRKLRKILQNLGIKSNDTMIDLRLFQESPVLWYWSQFDVYIGILSMIWTLVFVQFFYMLCIQYIQSKSFIPGPTIFHD